MFLNGTHIGHGDAIEEGLGKSSIRTLVQPECPHARSPVFSSLYRAPETLQLVQLIGSTTPPTEHLGAIHHLLQVTILSDSTQQRLPNLYQLLGLNGPDISREQINAALRRAQSKLESLKQDASRADDVARLQKVLALGQKYLLSPELKSNYDAQWTTIYGKPKSAVAKPIVAEQPVASAKVELNWDMSSLDALLPDGDPGQAFQMADYLRSSQVRDPMAAEADLRKLISLLGGEDLPASRSNSSADATSMLASQPISLQHLSDSLARPESGNRELPSEALPSEALTSGGFSGAESDRADGGIVMQRSANSHAAVGLAKRMRQKRQKAILFGGTLLAAGVGGLVLLGLYLNRPAAKSSPPVAQAQVPAKRSKLPPVPEATNDLAAALEQGNANAVATPPNVPSKSGLNPGLVQPGENVVPLQIQATPMKPDEAMKPDMTKPDMTKPDMTKPEAMKPEVPKADPAKPDPAKPDAPKPDAPKPDAPKPDAPKPDAMAEAPADAKLSNKEKKVWQEEMKQARTGLSKLDPVASEKQLADLKQMAKTAQQRQQLATLEQAVGLIRKAREAIVAAIGKLDGAQTFTVGASTLVSFVEGDETRIVLRMAGQRREFKLEAMPVGVGLALMKLEPNVVDANMEAAMGVYVMAHPNNQAAAPQARQLLEDAAAAGAISKEVAKFYSADYKVD